MSKKRGKDHGDQSWVTVAFNIRGVYGAPLYTGIQVNCATDVGRIEDIHFHPGFWEDEAADYWDYMLENGTGMLLKRSDWIMVNNYFCLGYFKGIDIEAFLTPQGDHENLRGHFFGVLSNIEIDFSEHGIYVGGTSVYQCWGFQVTNFVWNSSCKGANPPDYGIGIKVTEYGLMEQAALKIIGGVIGGYFLTGIDFESNSGVLMLTNISFSSQNNSTQKGIYATSAKVIVNSCHFQSGLDKAIDFGYDVTEVVIGNIFNNNDVDGVDNKWDQNEF